MRILFLTDRPLDETQRVDAYQTRMIGLRRGLEMLGVQTKTLSLRTLTFSRPHLLFALNAKAIARQAHDCDVIHAVGAGPTVAGIAAHACQVVFDVHGDELLETRLVWQNYRRLRTLYGVGQAGLLATIARRGADHFLVVSEPFRQRYEARGIRPNRITVIRNGVNVELFRSNAPPDLHDELRLAYAGGFQAWQAMDTLIDGFSQVLSLPVRLDLIGFTPADQTLRDQIAVRLGSRVRLEDRLPMTALPDWLARADVLLIPRTRHPAMQGGCPSKFAEYLAMGRPLIVTNVDETARFVRDYDCGLVCEPTADGLAAAITTATGWDAVERARLGHNARLCAETVFDWNVIARIHLDTLTHLVQRRWQDDRAAS
jgi:glycosyltransferase involved in cell wall biosynthesis